MLVRVALLFCITLILVAVMSFGWTIEDSNSQLQNSEDSSGVKSSALPSINKLAKFEPVKFDVAKHIGTNSGAGALLLNAHAASAPFTGTPYTGTAISLPGRMEAENFDKGGEGIAYHDTTSTNDGGYYRSEGVDVCTCGSPYGLSVGWTQNAEWMEYTVSVATFGTYKFQPLTATIISGSALHIEVDGVNVTGQMILPNTNAWGSYAATVSPAVSLTAGQHIVRVVVDVTGFLLIQLT